MKLSSIQMIGYGFFFWKERFLQVRKGKLSPREDGPFKVVKQINNNAYMIDLHSEYNVHNVFNVSDLSPCVVGDLLDSRTNHFQEGKYDNMGNMDDTNMSDMYPLRPFTRSQPKDLQGLQEMYMKRKALW